MAVSSSLKTAMMTSSPVLFILPVFTSTSPARAFTSYRTSRNHWPLIHSKCHSNNHLECLNSLWTALRGGPHNLHDMHRDTTYTPTTCTHINNINNITTHYNSQVRLVSSLTTWVEGGVGSKGSLLAAVELELPLGDTNCEGMWSPKVTGPTDPLWLVGFTTLLEGWR